MQEDFWIQKRGDVEDIVLFSGSSILGRIRLIDHNLSKDRYIFPLNLLLNVVVSHHSTHLTKFKVSHAASLNVSCW